jgi:hemolysin activation/secretion protein
VQAAVTLRRAIVPLLAFACLAQAQPAPEPRFAVRGFEIEGELPIPRDRAAKVLEPFTGETVGLEQLRAAAKALESELAERGFAFYRVVLPPQAIERAVRLRVLPFRLAQLSFSGQQHFSEANLRASLPTLEAGESPNVAAVARNRAHANEHAAKQLEVTFRQSATPDAVDAEVRVRDMSPKRVYAALQNTGEERTGHWRATLGAQHANLFDSDHSLAATYTTSPGHAGDVKQYGFFYTGPFYRIGGSLIAYAAYSDVNSGTVAEAFQVSGRGKFLGLRWRQHLRPAGAYSHALEAGVEDRWFDNNVAFGGAQLGVDVRSRPLVLGYQGRWDAIGSAVRGAAEFARNLGGGSDNSDPAYAGNRAGARRDWSAWRFALEGQWLVGAWTASARLRAQHAREPLIPGEQLAIGGAQSVRGLRERETTGERGYALSLEASTPLGSETMRGLLFVDSGEVRVLNTVPGQAAAQDAASLGAGLRWSAPGRWTLAADVAQVVNGTSVTSRGHRRGHVALMYHF